MKQKQIEIIAEIGWNHSWRYESSKTNIESASKNGSNLC